MFDMVVLPVVDWLPDQPPEAVQELALVTAQVSIADPPLVTEEGVALNDIEGRLLGG